MNGNPFEEARRSSFDYSKTEQKPLVKENPFHTARLSQNEFGPKPQERNIFQKAFSALTTEGPIEKIFDALGVPEISDIKKSIYSGALSAPRTLIDFPKNFIEAGIREFKPDYQTPEIVEKGMNLIAPARNFLPDYEKAQGYLTQASGRPTSEGFKGGLLESIAQGTGTGAIAGPPGILAGGLIGALDYAMKEMGISDFKRILTESAIAKAPSKPPQFKGGPGIPPAIPSMPKISTPMNLAMSILRPKGQNIHSEAAAALQRLGIENAPVQSFTKGGFANAVEGILENTPFAEKGFKELMSNFNDEMVGKVNNIIDSITPSEKFSSIKDIKDIGEPTFTNTLPAIIDQKLPSMQLTKREIGKIGTDFLKTIDENLRSEAKDLYNKITLTSKDVLTPDQVDYSNLQNSIRKSRRNLESKGYKGAARKEALNVLDEIERLFEKEGDTNLPIKISDIRKNLIDLNDKLSYDKPAVINLIEPVASSMRTLLGNYAEKNPNLGPLKQANKIFGQRARIFDNNKIVKRLRNQSDEQFFKSIQTPSILEEFKNISSELGNKDIYNSLRASILQDILRPVYQAKTPKEFAQSITDSRLNKIRELEPAYPELKGLSKSLEQAKNKAEIFETPEMKAKSTIREELLESSLLNSDPIKTLKSMRNPAGLNLVRKVLNDTPQGKSILKNLEQKTIENILFDQGKKNTLSIEEMSKIFDNPNDRHILKEILPEQSFKQLSDIVEVAKASKKGSDVNSSIKKFFTPAAGVTTAIAIYSNPFTAIKIGIPIYGITKALQQGNFRSTLLKDIQSKMPTSSGTKVPQKHTESK